ncbi:metal ABC transporter solute-binding protein, Zn/Mn family [Halostagnicola bangensis]
MELTRRSMVKAGGGAIALGAIAGCLGEPDGEQPEGGYAAFFPLWDWANEIADGEIDFENAIETGEMGHGWEPPSDLQRNIANSNVFVYLDTDEFPWAQEYASEFEQNHDNVTLIDGMDGLENQLLEMDSDGDIDREPPEYDFDPNDLEIEGFDVYNQRTGNEIAYWHIDHWHGGVPDIPLGGEVVITGIFEDDEGRVLPIGDDKQFQLEASFVEEEDEDIEIESRGDDIVFGGDGPTQARIVFELVADGDVVWDTSDEAMLVSVVEELEETEAPEYPDPHVWVDPVIAQDIVMTIADGLGDADGDNTELYEENARAYVEKLEEIDAQFEALTENASRDVAVFAGHDSYQYIEARYDFELHTPVGISPDEAETSADISEMIELVEEHDIETILYDPFETQNPGEDIPQMVEVLLEETDAEHYEPLSPVEGTIQEWNEAGYGWIEQMEEINLPSLRQALGAE